MNKLFLSLILVAQFISAKGVAGLLPSPELQCYWGCTARGGSHNECKNKWCPLIIYSISTQQNATQHHQSEMPEPYLNREESNSEMLQGGVCCSWLDVADCFKGC